MGVSLLVYVVSDGYDLGVGMLMHRATPEERDTMVASIGPFWDANETWLVLGVGLLLVAFPKAHGLVLSELYLPTALMLVGLILRGAAFDFRVKGKANRKAMWDRLFIAGSMLASVCQGWMLGRYISGFGEGWNYPIFAGAIAVALPMAYALLGATWLVMKTEGELQDKAIEWSKIAWPPMVVGLILISMATPWISETVRDQLVYLAGDDCGGVDPDHDGRLRCWRRASCSARRPCAAACAGCRSHCWCSCSS